MKHLLLVTYYFPPAAGGGVSRTLSFARHLPEHGWRITVLCADAASAPIRDETRDPRLSEAVRVVSVPTPSAITRGRRKVIGEGATRPSALYRWARAAASWIFLPDSFAPWRGPAVDAGRDLLARESFDAVLSSSPPDTVQLVGLDLRSHHRAPWIVDFRDPWIGLAYKQPPTPWHRARQRSMRDSVLAKADLVLATTPSLQERLAGSAALRSGARVEYLPNGWEDDVPTDERGTATGEDGLRIAYTGTLWDVPATATCLGGLAEAMGGSPGRRVRVDIVGPHESHERERVDRLGLGEHVHFHGQVPYERSRAIQRAADVLLLLKAHGLDYRLAIPGKLYEYVASGRPIIAFLSEGDAADLVRQTGGWVVDPEDREGSARMFERLLRGELPDGATPERKALAERYRRDRIAGELARMLDTVTSPREATDGR